MMCYYSSAIQTTVYFCTKDKGVCIIHIHAIIIESEVQNVSATNIAQVVNIAKEKARYDTEVKNVLSDKYILAWIISRVTEEFRGMSIQNIVQCIEGEPVVSKVYVAPGKTNDSIIGRDTQDKVPSEGEARFDILFHAFTPSKERIKIIINVEAQKNFYPGYDLVTRGIYYGARLLSSQKEREFSGEGYDEIKKVYSIWVCMNAPKYLQNTITEYRIQQNKLYGNYSKPARYDLLSVVMLCLGNPEDKDYRKNEYQKLLRLLSVLASEEVKAPDKLHILEKEYHIATTRELEGKVNIMCNWSEGVIERVTEKVTERVTREVTEQVTREVTREVTEQVTNQMILSSVESVMKSLEITTEKACNILQIKVQDYWNAKEASVEN